MARIGDVLPLGRRKVAPLDRDTAEMAAARVVEAGLVRTPHYDPSSPHFGGRDLHESGAVSGPYTGPHVEGSAIVANPMMAAVVPAENYMRDMRHSWGLRPSRTRSTVGRVESWEADLFRMMRSGPGFVGTAASMYAEWMAGSGQLIVQERASREPDSGLEEWVDSDYEPALEVLRMWRGEDATQSDLMRDALTYLDSVGQFYQCLRKSSAGHWVYDLWAHSAMRGNPDTNRLEARGLPEADREDPLWYREYPPQLVDHLFLGDREWRGKPTSQMQRVMPDIYRLILAERSMDRDLLSRLATNGVLWIPSSPGGKDWTADLAEWSGQAFSGTFDENYVPGLSGRLEEVAPFPMQSVGEPKYIDVGRDVSRAMEVWQMAWNAICLGLDMPKNAMDGNESANRWTGFLNRDEEALKAAAPRMQRLAAMVERTHFRVWARLLHLDRPISDFRVWYRLPDVRPERTAEKLDISRVVVPTRTALAQTVGWKGSDLADVPEGMTDFEAMFLMVHGRPLDAAMAATEAMPEPAGAETEDDPERGAEAAEGEPPPPDFVGELAPGVNELDEPELPPVGEMLAASLRPRPLPGEARSWDQLVPG